MSNKDGTFTIVQDLNIEITGNNKDIATIVVKK